MSDLVTPWTAAYQAPPSMGFSRQEYWSGVLLPSSSIIETQDIFTIKKHAYFILELVTIPPKIIHKYSYIIFKFSY